MAKRPVNLLYDVNENPPPQTLLLLGIQHILVLSVAFVLPVIIVDAIGGVPADSERLICMAMIASGAATILQGLNKGPVGSGYLCPMLNGPAFLSATLVAGKIGGLPLIFGMTALAGVFEAFFSRIVYRLRAVFPSEVTGTIVMMIGIEIVPIGVTRFLGIDSLHPGPDPVSAAIGVITLLSMIGFNIWGNAKLRLYSVLLGFLLGYTAAFVTGVLPASRLAHFWDAPLLRIPDFGPFRLSFDIVVLIPFLVAALSSALKTMGDLSTCQKINDAEWKRPDMNSISRGILAGGIGNMLSGFLGSLGQSPSSGNVGLSLATGATSRLVAWAIGGLLIAMAFIPKLAAVFVIMPTPVLGAIVVFSACFMIMAGIQIITSRLIDARKTFVIGISVTFGLCVDFLPQVFKNLHPWVQPFAGSSLSLATFCAIFMNLLMRVGVSKAVKMELLPGVDSSDKVFYLMENQGATWGALKEVVHRASAALNEFLEYATAAELARGPLDVTVRFDEFNLDIDIAYEGVEARFPTKRPAPEDLLDDPDAMFGLSGYLIRQSVDKLRSWSDGKRAGVTLHFNH